MSLSRMVPGSNIQASTGDLPYDRTIAIDSELVELDAKIAGLQEAARRLREERNALCNTARVLPPELLVLIFLQYAKSTYCEAKRYGADALLLPAHICRFWRDSVIHCSEYWRYVPLDKPSWLEHMTQKSGEFPLIAWLTCCHVATSQDAPVPIQRVMPRVRFLTIQPNVESAKECGMWAFEEVIEKVIKGRSQQLKHLTTSVNPDVLSYVTVPRGEQASKDEMPELEFLHLSGFDWSWKNPIFVPSLTHLRLRGYINPRDPEFFNALRSLEQLEIMELEAISDPGSYSEKSVYVEVPRYPNPVYLNRLRTFELSGVPGPCALLLYGLAFPLTTKISLVCDYRCPSLPFFDEGHPPEFVPELPEVELVFRNVFGWVSEHYRPPGATSDLPLLCVHVETQEVLPEWERGFLIMKIYDADADSRGSSEDISKVVDFQLHATWTLATEKERLPTALVLAQALQAFPLSSIKRLSTDLQLRSPEETPLLEAALSQLTHLEKLSLTWTGVGPSLFPYLSRSRGIEPSVHDQDQISAHNSEATPSTRITAKNPNPFSFPALETLEVEGVDFENAEYCDEEDLDRRTSTWGKYAAHLLHDAVHERQIGALPLANIVLKDCRRMPSWLADVLDSLPDTRIDISMATDAALSGDLGMLDLHAADLLSFMDEDD